MTYPEMSQIQGQGSEMGSLTGAAAEHYAQAEQFMGPGEGGNAHGDIIAGKGGPEALNSGGFAASEIPEPTGVIHAPDDSVQVETGYFPLNINPAIAAMQDEPGDVGK